MPIYQEMRLLLKRPAWFISLLAAVFVSQAGASAWSPKKGHGLIVWQTYSYRATERFDSDGRREALGPEASFRSTILQGWLEAGITDRWTLLTVVPVGRLRYSDRWGAEESFALGDVQAGLRYQLRRTEQGWQVALQTLGKAPGYSARIRPRPGNGQADWEGSLLLGRSFPVGSRWGYLATESGFRKRWGRPADQFRAEIAAGLHLTNWITVSGQYFAIRGLGSLLPPERSTNPLVEPRFDLHKVQASGTLRVTSSIRVQVGWSWDVSGRNVGAGRALVVGLWQAF
mgnify:CR=1 FL=1